MTVRELWDQVPGNLYVALDVAPSASDSAIQQAWHRAARQVHPDTGGDGDRFRTVHVAYLVLSDPEQRRRYDRHILVTSARRTAVAHTDPASPNNGDRVDLSDEVPSGVRPGQSPSVAMIWLMAIVGLCCVVLAYLVPWTTLVTGVGVGIFVMIRYLRMWGRQP